MGSMNESSIANSIWVKGSNNKYLCSYADGDKLYLQECNKNDKKQRWTAITITTTTITTVNYTAVKFKGTLPYDDTLFLSVPKLGLIDTYDMTITDPYYSWFVTSTTKPSYLYLSNGVSGNTGKPSNYCLDLSNRVNNNNDKYNYLRIVKCSDAKYKFKFNGSYSNGEINSIRVYDNNDKPYSINKNEMCLYYSMSPRVIKCNDVNKSKQIKWIVSGIKTVQI